MLHCPNIYICQPGNAGIHYLLGICQLGLVSIIIIGSLVLTFKHTHTHNQKQRYIQYQREKKESMTQLTNAIDWRRIFLHSCEYSQQHRNIHTYTYGLVIFVIFIIIVVSQSLLAAAAATAAETCTNSHSHTNTLAPQQ